MINKIKRGMKTGKYTCKLRQTLLIHNLYSKQKHQKENAVYENTRKRYEKQVTEGKMKIIHSI